LFKLTRPSGRYNAKPTRQTNRVQGVTNLRGSDITLSQRRRPAFLPDTPEEQTWDSNSPRVDEYPGNN
jgi:hypothetical protein